jgi:hypothetical protein
MSNEIYVSTDIESDGPIPGPNSMLSFGSAAFRPDKTLVDTFERNLVTLAEATPDPIVVSRNGVFSVAIAYVLMSIAEKRMPMDWFDDVPHTHVALDDAIEQGRLFCNMLAARRRER